MRLTAAPSRSVVAVAVAVSILAGGCTGDRSARDHEPSASGASGSETSKRAPVILPGAPGDAPEVAGGDRPARLDRDDGPAASSVDYVRMMIPHHQQALTMTALAPERAHSPEVRDIAGRIRGAQRAEIGMMQGWLRRHDQRPVPEGSAREMPDRRRAGMGMATRAQMDRLRAASGADFDRRFLRLMIPHHEGAVRMAVDVLSESEDPLVRSMAKDVLATQRDEIAAMRRMLSRVG